MEIRVDSVWVNKETRVEAMVVWSSNELVTYCNDGDKTLNPVRKFAFIQDYKEQGDE